MQWWDVPSGKADVLKPDNSYLVVGFKVHEPSAWKLNALNICSQLVSSAVATLMQKIERALVLRWDESHGQHTLLSANLVFQVDGERAGKIQTLLAQEKINEKTGERRAFSNAYRFTSCEGPSEDGFYQVTANLVQGTWNETLNRHGKIWKCSHTKIDATTGFQQLLQIYFARTDLAQIPRALRPGICQEVAQEVSSYLGNLISTKVKGETSFPTVEDRDPVRRRDSYEKSLDALANDVRPLVYKQARELDPTIPANDPRGNRWLLHDPRWDAIMRSPDPKPIPLFFVDGKSISILEGTHSFDAGISKKNRHRGAVKVPSNKVLDDRPKRVQQRGQTGLQAWYAAVPIAYVATRPEQNKKIKTRNLDLGLKHVALQGGKPWRRDPDSILLPLSGECTRLEKILRRDDVEIAWSRLVCRKVKDCSPLVQLAKDGGLAYQANPVYEWFLQLTIRYVPPKLPMPDKMLGIAFGLDAILTWQILSQEDGSVLSEGAFEKNPQIAAFLKFKQRNEKEQSFERWTGGQTFSKNLEAITHGLANQIVNSALLNNARLCIEDISYVQKSGSDSETNLLFSAWNYGQLRTFIEYKARAAGLPEPFFCSDYVTNFTCPKCEAIRTAKQPSEKANTYKENGNLVCRKCKQTTPLTPSCRALTAAKHGRQIVIDRAAKAAAKTKDATSIDTKTK